MTWRPVLGFESHYEVSDLGAVRRSKPGRGARAGHQLKAAPSWQHYAQVVLCVDGVKTTRLVCHLVCEAFHGPRPAGQEVRHLDGDRSNNSASNLAWGTRLDNAADMRRHGTHHNAAKTHCKNGHPFSETNTAIGSCGKRICITCRAASNRRSKQKKRGSQAALKSSSGVLA